MLKYIGIYLVFCAPDTILKNCALYLTSLLLSSGLRDFQKTAAKGKGSLLLVMYV